MTDKKKDRPFVFVRCLTYNHEKYIEDALKGFVMQKTDFPFLAVVIDDCSTDGTADIVRRYEAQYPDIIKGIYLPHNFRSRGEDKRPYYQEYVDKATYWAECEGDDYWTDPHKLQKQVDFLDTHPEYGLCYTDYNIYYHSTSIIREACFANGYNRVPNSFAEHLIAQGYIAPMTWLYRVDVFNSFKDSIPKAPTDGSYVYALEFFLHSKVYFLDEVTATYRVSEGTASRPSTAEKMIKYRKGVYAIQQQYALRTSETAGYAPIFKANEVLELLPLALDEHLNKYVDEYIAKANGLHLSVDTCIALYQMKNEVRKARSSYAYRLGKFLLRPFSFIRHRILK